MLCSEQMLEGLAGTAPEMIQNWILVEYCSAWPAKIQVKDLKVSAEFQKKLQEIAKQDGWKIVLIRKPKVSGTKVYWSDGSSIRWVEQEGDWSWEQKDHWQVLDHPLVLVCTHGKRDQCCGILGGKVFAKLHSVRPAWLWQSSHLGGHRFAPTLLSLPDGMSYGRVPEEEAVELLEYMERGEPWHIEYRRGSTKLLHWQQVLQLWLEEEDIYGEVFLESEHQRAYIDIGDGMFGVQISYKVLGTCLPSCGDSMEKEIGEWSVDAIKPI